MRASIMLATSLLVGLAGVVFFSVRDASREAALERFAEDTAVGDTKYYRLPNPPLAVSEPILKWQGRGLVPASVEKVKIDDGQMRRVVRDEATGFSLYRRRAQGDAGELHIKIDLGEYLSLRAR
jgi:hypothetical protein